MRSHMQGGGFIKIQRTNGHMERTDSIKADHRAVPPYIPPITNTDHKECWWHKQRTEVQTTAMLNTALLVTSSKQGGTELDDIFFPVHHPHIF